MCDATVNAIEALLNRVDDIYARDVQIGFRLVAIVVRTDPATDPYAFVPLASPLGEDAGKLKDMVQAEWDFDSTNSITPAAGVLTGPVYLTDINPPSGKTDVVHMLTGSAICCNEAGAQIAGTSCGPNCISGGPICQKPEWAFSLTSDNILDDYDDRRVNCMAHELGHNFGASHCDDMFNSDCIYCDSQGICNLGIMLSTPPTWSSGFSPQSQHEIRAHLSNELLNPCLAQGWIYVNAGASFPFWGTQLHPLQTVSQGVQTVPAGGHVVVMGSNRYPEDLTFNRAMTLSAEGSPVVIGH